MQFKHPELLYALFLLLIPIIVHLFQLRKFQKVAFTNVAFLKEATLQTRKSSQIKKWLILLTRLLLIAAIVIAFTQPFTSKINTFKTKKETVIYIDNSFSTQAKGSQGELLKRAIQDIISHVPETENMSVITNDKVFKNTTINAIKNELLQLSYSPNSLTTQAVLLKGNTLFSKQTNSLKNLILISDFQENNTPLTIEKDSLTNIHFVKLQPVNTHNISVDSVFISEKTARAINLKVILKNNGSPIENLPISLFNNDTLIAKTSVAITKEANTTFSVPANTIINGKITINDSNLQFDNTLFFNINNTSKINVLALNATDDSFLKRIYTNDEFNYISTTENQLNYSLLESQNLIILNELSSIPNALTAALKAFTNQGGSIIIIPSKDITNTSYNTLLLNYQASFNEVIQTEKRITTINYAHPLYNNGVFEKQVSNFQYPKVNSYFNANLNNASSILKYEDGKPFLFQNNYAYIFTSALNNENSNFKNSPLIVPTLYNIGKQSFKTPELYYTIGKNNTFDVSTQLKQDAVLSLTTKVINMIPEQRYFNNKVVIKTSEAPNDANIYAVKNNNSTIKNVSYNYSRTESDLVYKDLSNIKNIILSNSISKTFDTIKSDTKINALWKWFVIFALALLIIEMLILKYFK
ncbi:BatA domain-containing protein [Thalassobellus suaedae]|uniref:BatA domain-containing protein n=1 Tax=Thalassobellus suaedae TaxID=3074124 RepID=A0ABY9XV57_9FLAO|nr:BatA domain-containing protein [Flavobacteriaceae bacterium HL-DH14]WNH11715.1 BatA domain-containing protein [Flavobacteriaceae bacterium HL-DH10]